MEKSDKERIRAFNRAVTQRVGALNESFLGRGRPLGQARLLYEIGEEGAVMKTLRERLSLDSGYLSRLVGALQEQGLISVTASRADLRAKQIRLSAKGQRELRAYNKKSDAYAVAVIAALSTSQRDRLVTAMGEVETLLQAAAVVIAPEPSTSAEAQWCLRQYFLELDERFEGGFDVSLSISASAQEIAPPKGQFLMARLDGEPIGCGALKMGGKRIGEIKRMWVAPSARGLGVSRRLLESLESHAKKSKMRVLRLETNRTLTEAQGLYRSAGYQQVKPFNDEPFAHHWFEKKL